MSRFFNQDNAFFTIMGVVCDLVILNLLTLLCCLPVVTAGASFTAMHAVLWRMVRGEQTYVARQFFAAFRRNWRQATPVWLVLLAVGLVTVVDLMMALRVEGPLRYVIEVVAALIALVALAIGQYFFILLSRYDDPTRRHLTNALKCAVGFLPRTLAMVVILVAAALVYARYFFTIVPLVALLGFALPQYCCAWLYNPIFARLER